MFYKEWRRKHRRIDKIGLYIYVSIILITLNYYTNLFYYYNQNAGLTINQGLHYYLSNNYTGGAALAETQRAALEGRIVKSAPTVSKSSINVFRKNVKIGRGVARVNYVVINGMFNKYQAIPVNGHTSVKNYAKYYNGIAAINTNYFKRDTKQSLGLLMINKDVVSGPMYERVAMGIGENSFEMGRVKFNGEISSLNKKVAIDNVNQPRTISTEVLVYNKNWGKHPIKFPKYGMQINISDDVITAKSTTLVYNSESQYIIIGPMSKLDKFNIGEKINLNLELAPTWNVNHIISGGPYLVKNGQVYVDIAEERLKGIGGYNPRSAIGYTADNKLVLVVVDGRRENSSGVTLTQLASIMKNAGCINAMNLDGGTSSQLVYNGSFVNKPLVKGGARVSSAIVITKL